MKKPSEWTTHQLVVTLVLTVVGTVVVVGWMYAMDGVVGQGPALVRITALMKMMALPVLCGWVMLGEWLWKKCEAWEKRRWPAAKDEAGPTD